MAFGVRASIPSSSELLMLIGGKDAWPWIDGPWRINCRSDAAHAHLEFAVEARHYKAVPPCGVRW